MGKLHEISIPSILEVGPGKSGQAGEILYRKGFRRIVIFWGPGIMDMFGKDILQSIDGSGIQITNQLENDNTDVCSIMSSAFTLPSSTELIVGIGGGRVLDVAKYIAFLNNIPFLSVPTSAAHDGFASSGCSLSVHGKRTSVPARIPYGIIVDTEIIRQSPDKFIFSGIGDLVSKISAVYDWEYESIRGYAVLDDFAVMIAKKSVNSVVRVSFPGIKDEFFIKELVDSLTMSGIAMEIAGNSAPASGSEHLISHALDKISSSPRLHGIQVGVATYLMTRVQNHRYERVEKFLKDTGFFDHVKENPLSATELEAAIDLAPSIKPGRHTYIHDEDNRKLAKRLLREDEILKSILY